MELVNAQPTGDLRNLLLCIRGAVRCESTNRGEEWSRKLLPVHVECPNSVELFLSCLKHRDVLSDNELKSGTTSGISARDPRLLEYSPRSRAILHRTVVALLRVPCPRKSSSANDSTPVIECPATHGVRFRFRASAQRALCVLQRRHLSLGNIHAGVVLHHAHRLWTRGHTEPGSRARSTILAPQPNGALRFGVQVCAVRRVDDFVCSPCSVGRVFVD